MNARTRPSLSVLSVFGVLRVLRGPQGLRTAGVLLAVGGLLVSGCSTGSSAAGTSRAGTPRGEVPTLAPLPKSTPDSLKPFYDQKLRWHACGGGAAGFQCARMKAPLDYAEPGAGDLDLAVARKKSDGHGKRLGSLLVNPGGPGGSAIGYLESYAAFAYPAKVRAHYDMVAVDPRGVAHSDPVSCLDGKRMDAYTKTDTTPDDRRERGELVASFKKFAAGCETHSATVLPHVSTVEAARDMDVLRAVLGDRKLAYVGASYGTFLGATYAGLYPDRVGRLVLDGAMDPSLSARRMNLDQTTGFGTAFRSFAQDCAKREDCPLATGASTGDTGNAGSSARTETRPSDSARTEARSGDPARRRARSGSPAGTTVRQAGANLSTFFRRLDRTPIPTGTPGRPLGEALATTGVIAAMYDEGSWPQLRSALTAAMQDKDGAGLLALSDSYYEREDSGKYSNLMSANAAVNCLDLPTAFTGPEQVEKAVPAFKKASPVFGEGLAWASLTCAYWPERATGEPHRIEAKGAAPIVVVGTTRDPATPYTWARALAAQLDSGTLLTYNGDGHTAYGRGSTCVDATIDRYLVTGTAPKHGKRCS